MAVSQGSLQAFLDSVRRWLDLQAGSIWSDLKSELAGVSGNVLDVGCGAQPYRCLLPPEVKYRGIDTADAKAHFGYDVPDTIYYSGETWPVEDESVDLIICTETLEHVLRPMDFLAEARRCLRSGGRFVLTVPFAARWHFIPHDYWRYTPSSLRYLLEETGFMDIVVYARGNAVTVACYKAMALILPLLFPQQSGISGGLVRRIAGIVLSPLLLSLALIANLSLLGPGGDDCLGYTAMARACRADKIAPPRTESKV
jgi:SAM-dependent methyltransferase